MRAIVTFEPKARLAYPAGKYACTATFPDQSPAGKRPRHWSLHVDFIEGPNAKGKGVADLSLLADASAEGCPTLRPDEPIHLYAGRRKIGVAVGVGGEG